MKNFVILICILFIIICSSVTGLQANGGSFGEGNLAQGQLTLLNSKQISLEKEDLTIYLYKGYAEVKLVYQMKNTGNKTKVRLGFPSLIYPTDMLKKQEIEDYTILCNGKKIASRYSLSKDQVTWVRSKALLQGMDADPGTTFPHIGWHVSGITFEKQETKKISISYISHYATGGYYVSESDTYGNSRFTYLLSIGSTWKGPIRQGSVIINTEGIRDAVSIFPEKRFRRDQRIYRWEFKDLEPKGKDNIVVTLHDGFHKDALYGEGGPSYVYKMYKSYFLQRKATRVTASSSLKGYKPQNGSDNRLNTAWVEGKPGQGTNQYLEFHFDTPTRIDKIGIIPGYNKSRTIFYKNNRIAEIEVLVNNKVVVREKIPDGYTSHGTGNINAYHIINLRKNNSAVKNLKLKIKKVYRGSDYNDTCISEVLFLERLSKRPENAGSR